MYEFLFIGYVSVHLVGYKIVLLWEEGSIYSLQFSFIFCFLLVVNSFPRLFYPCSHYYFLFVLPLPFLSIQQPPRRVMDELYIERFFLCLDRGTVG